jgi:peptidoglycan/LPS O-acetylase OafA/YrhL
MSLYIRNNTCSLGLYLDDTFLRFVIEFVLGITIALDTYKRKMNQYSSLSIIAFAAIELTCFIILMETSLLYNLPEYMRYSITTFSRICFYISYKYFPVYGKELEKLQKIVPLLSAMSLASYSVYLFHRPLLTILVKGATWNWLIHQMLPKV